MLNDCELRPLAMFINLGERETFEQSSGSQIVALVGNLRLVAAAAYDVFFALGDVPKATSIIQRGVELYGLQTVVEASLNQAIFRVQWDGQDPQAEKPFLEFVGSVLFPDQ